MSRMTCKQIGVVLVVVAALLLVGAAGVCEAMAPRPIADASGQGASVHIIPSADGVSLYAFAERLDGLGTRTHAHLTSYEPGHTSYEPGHTDCDPNGNACQYTFQDLPILRPGISSPALTLVITTTHGLTGTRTLASSDFISQHIAGDQPTEIVSLDNNVRLYVHAGALQPDSYVVIMPTVGPPGAPPAGHRLISRAYSLRPSGGQEQVAQDLSLCINYMPDLLGESAPQTLSIFRWDPVAVQWFDIQSEPLGEQATHCQSIRRFGTYALMIGTTWRDSFQDYGGLAERQGVRIAYGGRLALRNNAVVGHATSLVISPAGLGAWQRVTHSAEVTASTALTVSLLDGDTGEVLLAGVVSDADLSSVDPTAHPTLQMRVDLGTSQPGHTPYLDTWAVSWMPATAPLRRLYLPVMIHDGNALSPVSSAAGGSRAHSASNGYGCDPPPKPPITWSTPVALTQGDTISIAPDLAVDAEKRVHAVWYRGNGPVFYSAKESGAQTWSAPMNISGSGSGWYPDIAADPQGTVHVIWEQETDIRYAAKPRGGAWSAPINLSRTDGAWIMPALHVDTVGNLHAVWVDHSPGNYEILYAYKGHDAASWEAPERVSNTSGTSWAPSVVADSQGGVHVVWYDFTPGVTEIYYAYKTPGAAVWSAATNVSNTAGGSQWPALAADVGGGLHLVWQDTLPLAGQGQALILYYAAKPAGADWSQPLELARDLANDEKPQTPALAISPSGALHVAWASMTDYRLRYAIKPDAETGWSVPQVVASLIPPPNPTNQWYFIGLAADFDRGVHLVWNDMARGGTFNQDIRYAAAIPPPIPADHVLVLDESGRAVSGACIYRNGRLAGATDDLGIFALDALTTGESLVAVKPLAGQPAARRSGWAYRTALTSLALGPGGEVLGHTVSAAGRQRLTVSSDWPLIYFNLLVSIQWNATPEYLQEVASAMRQASDYLYDVSDGQMAFGQVALYDNAQHWEDADIQILARNNVRPYAYRGGVTSADPGMTIRVGRHWNGKEGDRGGWDEPNGFRTLIHEFGHYALYLWDSYFEYDARYAGGVNTATGCIYVDATDYYTPTEAIATNATIMDYQYRTSELAARGVSDLWSDDCFKTAQWQKNQESDWETLLRYYADTADAPRWRLISPRTRGHVLAGPTTLPREILAFPEIGTHDSGLAASPRQVTVLGLDGRPYRLGALVALETQREGVQIIIDQGLTAGSSDEHAEIGQITVYGATPDNKIRATSIDGSLWDEKWVDAGMSYTLTLRSTGGLTAAAAPINPYAILIPDSEGRDLLLAINGVGAAAALSALLVPPGGVGQTIALSYSPDDDVYTGVASFPALTTGLGSVHVRGLGGIGQIVGLDNDFHLAQVASAEDQDFYSPDGAAWLHLDAGSFAQGNVNIILMPTGAVPQPLPAGMRALGNAYSIRVSGGITGTVAGRDAVLRLFYAPDDLVAASPADLRIARWDGTAWRLLTGQLDPERFTVAVQTDRLGVYALLAPEAVEGPRVYLPVLLR